MTRVLFLSLALGLASTVGAVPLDQWLDNCDKVTNAKVLVDSAGGGQSTFTEKTWDDLRPKIRAVRTNRFLLGDNFSLYTLGVTGKIPNPWRLMEDKKVIASLKEANDLRVQTAMNASRMERVERYFEWRVVSDWLRVLAPAESTFDKVMRTGGTLSTEIDADLLNELIRLKSELSQLKGREISFVGEFAKCQPAQVEEKSLSLSSSYSEESVRQTIKKALENLSGLKECEAIEKGQEAFEKSRKADWIPNVVYGFERNFPTDSGRNSFNEWYAGLELSVPLGSNPDSKIAEVAECRMRLARHERAVRAIGDRAIAEVKLLGALKSDLSQLRPALLQMPTAVREGIVSLRKYVHLLKRYQTISTMVNEIEASVFTLNYLWGK